MTSMLTSAATPATVSAATAPLNAFTVDLEDWYQGLEIDSKRWGVFEHRLEIGTERLLELLDETGTSATFFVLGYAAERSPELIREIARRGHEIGTHGYSHQFVYRMTRESFAADLNRSLDTLSALCEHPIRGYRAPYFSITKAALWALDLLRDSGITFDSSIFPVHNYRYGIPDARRDIHEVIPGLVEFPPSTVPLMGRNVPLAGGAYFRLFPYTCTRFGLRRLSASGQAAAFYIHPWELDPEHPRLELPARIGMTHYWGLSGTHARLRKLLGDFNFGTMSQALEQANHPVVNL